MAQAKATSTPIADAYGTPEFFAMELSALENLGPCYRLTFTVPETTMAVPVFRVVMPAEAIQQMLVNLPVLIRNLPTGKLSHESTLSLN
jgi:hypothetical protein